LPKLEQKEESSMNQHNIKNSIFKNILIASVGLHLSISALAITDEEIAHIVVTANTVDINAGKVAQKKAKHADVIKFADWMVNGHGSINHTAAGLVSRLKIKPADNSTSKDLVKGGEENIAKLNKLSNEQFDMAYMTAEVAYHDAVLDAINKTLIPNAKNKELKETLIKSEAIIQGHVVRAREIVADLNKKSNN